MVKKTDLVVEEIKQFETMKKFLLSSFPHDVPKPTSDSLEFGYIEPGHGLKGKKEWILDEEDVEKFLEKCREKKHGECTLWCYSKGEGKKHTHTKRSRSPCKSPSKKSSKARSSQYDSHVTKMAKIDEIYQSLDKTHGSLYTPEQKRAWAHMIDLGKHSSQAIPPNKRFFQKCTGADASCSITDTGGSSKSPGKKVKIRSECIDQLQKWHDLLNCGAITQNQYDEFQDKILKDIRDL